MHAPGALEAVICRRKGLCIFSGSHINRMTCPVQVTYTEDGLEAVIFTADGDMRQALNNMQATQAGFGLVNQENVFKVLAVSSRNSCLCLCLFLCLCPVFGRN